jgi:NTE family protein
MSTLTIALYKPDILIDVSKDTCGIYDFYKAAEIIEVGKNAARISLKDLVA